MPGTRSPARSGDVDVLIQLIWPNGGFTTGETFEEVEIAVRMAQWRTYETVDEFRTEMRARAFVWSGDKIPEKTTSEGLIRALYRAHMFLMFE